MIPIKPSGKLLNWSNPYTKGLVFAALPGSKSRHELITGQKGILLTSGTYTGLSVMGDALSSTSTLNGGVFYPYSPLYNSITNRITIIVWAKVTTTISFTHFLCVPNHVTWTNPFSSFTLTTSDGAKLTYQNSVGGTVHNTSTTANYISAGSDLAQYAVSVDGAVARFFVNGLFKEQVTLTDAGNIDLGDKVGTVLMNRTQGDNDEGLSGLVPYALVYNRGLKDNEILNLWVDPFTLFKQSQLPILNTTAVGATTYSSVRMMMGMGF